MTEHQPEAPADLEAPGDALAAELAKLKSACRTLGKIVTGQHRAMEAAAIEMRQNGPHEAMQWILNSIPDQRDDEETRWDGKESAQEWFDRVEAAYRAAEAASEEKTPAARDGSRERSATRGRTMSTTEETHVDIDATRMWRRRYADVQAVLDDVLSDDDVGAGEGIAQDVALLAAQRDTARTRLAAVYAELEDAVRERDAAEAKLARIATHCRHLLDAAIVQGPVSHLCWDIQAIIDGKEPTP